MLVSNNSLTYTFTGTGTNALTGPGRIVKDGVGLMILNNTGTNTGTGEVDINNGALQIGGSDNRLPVGGSVVLADSATATLDLNNFNQTLGSVSGGGSTGGNITEGSGNLTITGSGNYGGIISGTGSLLKTTGGSLVLTGANLYSGGTVISGGGGIQTANSLGSGLGTGPVTIGTGSQLTLGDGVTADGNINAGIITNNGSLYLNPASGSLVFPQTVVGSGAVYKSFYPGSGDITVYITNANAYTGQTLVNEGILQISDSHALGTGTISVGNSYGSPNTELALANNITISNAIVLGGKTGGHTPPAPHINSADDYLTGLPGTNTITGSVTISGSTLWGINSDSGKLILAGPFINNGVASGGGGFFLSGSGDGQIMAGIPDSASNPGMTMTMNGSGTWTLSGTNTYTGATTINAGTLVVNGALLSRSKLMLLGGALTGTGVIMGAVTNDGTIFPGSDGTFGTLTISNALYLDSGGTASMDVGAAGNDQIRGIGSLTYGGVLNVNLTGTLTGNCVFKLFDATNYAGAFDSINLPDISPLTWDTSRLAVDGTIHAVGAPVVTPSISRIVGGTNGFNLSGTGTLVAPYGILSTTNLTLPLGNWQNIGGGTFSNGGFFFTDPATNAAQRFYILTTPAP
jgi:autotransporter-associated beta strand protein